MRPKGRIFIGCIPIFANIIIKFIGFPTFASIRPHKKAVKKIEAEGAKEKQSYWGMAMQLAGKSH